jgi:hypothetical protein
MAIGSSFRGHEYDVCGSGLPRARDRNPARDGIFAACILTSFVLESLLLALLGAFAGILLMLPFNGMQTGTSNAVTFSEVVFALQITWRSRGYADRVRTDHGIFWRARSRVARGAAEYSFRAARLACTDLNVAQT